MGYFKNSPKGRDLLNCYSKLIQKDPVCLFQSSSPGNWGKGTWVTGPEERADGWMFPVQRCLGEQWQPAQLALLADRAHCPACMCKPTCREGTPSSSAESWKGLSDIPPGYTGDIILPSGPGKATSWDAQRQRGSSWGGRSREINMFISLLKSLTGQWFQHDGSNRTKNKNSGITSDSPCGQWHCEGSRR